MKYLISILLLSLSGYVVATPPDCPPNNPNCEYPGYTPDWNDRFNVTCAMSSVETGEVRAESMTGGLDYAQAGRLYAYQVNATRDWYSDLAGLVETMGGDTRTVPTPDSPMTQFIQIEADIADR